jgi:hypothetical protein
MKTSLDELIVIGASFVDLACTHQNQAKSAPEACTMTIGLQ